MNKKNTKKTYRKKCHSKNPFVRFGNWWHYLAGGWKATIIVLTSLVLIVAVAGGYIYSVFNSINRKNVDNDLIEVEPIAEGIKNIALFGIDTRDGKSFSGNSDTIMILSVNTKVNKIKMVSVMRDSLVPIVDKNDKNKKYKSNKINYAYGKGGPAMAINTLNSNFGLDIEDYVTVNFFGMEKIIEAMGGIEVPVTEDEMAPKKSAPKGMLNQCIQEQADKDGTAAVLVKSAGTQVLNGRQTVAWARIRKAKNYWGHNDDFGRTERQRYVMQKLFETAKTLPWSKYISLIDALLPCTETSLTNNEILSLAKVLTVGGISMESARIPTDKMIINADYRAPGASTVYYNIEDAKELIHAFIFDDVPAEQYDEQATYSKKDWYGGGSVSSSHTGSSSSGNSTSQSSSASSSSSVTSSSENSSGGSSSDSFSSGSSSSDGSSSGSSENPSSSSGSSSSSASSSSPAPDPSPEEPTSPEGES